MAQSIEMGMKKMMIVAMAWSLNACDCSRTNLVEPLDIMVSQQVNHLELGDDWNNLDVTHKKVTQITPQGYRRQRLYSDPVP